VIAGLSPGVNKGVVNMNVTYFYCSCCGYEDFDIFVAYSRTCANGDFYICPECGEESSSIEIE